MSDVLSLNFANTMADIIFLHTYSSMDYLSLASPQAVRYCHPTLVAATVLNLSVKLLTLYTLYLHLCTLYPLSPSPPPFASLDQSTDAPIRTLFLALQAILETCIINCAPFSTLPDTPPNIEYVVNAISALSAHSSSFNALAIWVKSNNTLYANPTTSLSKRFWKHLTNTALNVQTIISSFIISNSGATNSLVDLILTHLLNDHRNSMILAFNSLYTSIISLQTSSLDCLVLPLLHPVDLGLASDPHSSDSDLSSSSDSDQDLSSPSHTIVQQTQDANIASDDTDAESASLSQNLTSPDDIDLNGPSTPPTPINHDQPSPNKANRSNTIRAISSVLRSFRRKFSNAQFREKINTAFAILQPSASSSSPFPSHIELPPHFESLFIIQSRITSAPTRSISLNIGTPSQLRHRKSMMSKALYDAYLALEQSFNALERHSDPAEQDRL